MSEVQALLRHYSEVRNRLRRPPNAVPDTGINLRRDRSAPPATEPPAKTECKIQLTPIEQRHVETYRTSFCRKDLTFKSILTLVATEFGLEYRDITRRSRVKTIVLPRQIAFYIANKHLEQSLSGMARYMGLDHTSVLHGRNKIKKRVAEDDQFRDQIVAIEGKLFENFNRPPVSALNKCLVEVESGPCSQVGKIFSVDNSGGSASDGPKEGSDQDVAGEVHIPTTAIREEPQEEQ